MCYLSIDLSLQDGKYTIKFYVSLNGLRKTYQAVQTILNRIVIIKEIYMHDLCSRKSGTAIILTDNVNLSCMENEWYRVECRC